MARSDFSFFYSLKIRYAEIDAQGIVFNAHYLTFMDTAVYEYFRSMEFDFRTYIETTGKDFHTIHAELDFSASSGLDEVLEVGVRTTKIGNSSLTFQMNVFGEGEDESRVRGGLVWVHTDLKTSKSQPLPQELRRVITAFEGLG